MYLLDPFKCTSMLTCALSSVHSQSFTITPDSVNTLCISKRAKGVEVTVLAAKVVGFLHAGYGMSGCERVCGESERE